VRYIRAPGGTRVKQEPTRRGHRIRGIWLLLAVAVAVPAMAAVAPGAFRLVVMQPARDLVFFQREISPWRDFSAIERHRPQPTRTHRLPAASVADDEIEIELDEWHPAHTPAPVALLFHGASPRGRSLGFNLLLAERLRDAGWLVLTPDTRGFGRSGRPRNLRDPAAWSVRQDKSRLMAYAREHPLGTGTVVAVGHSQGASYLLQAEHEFPNLSALALIGPRRYPPEFEPDWWQRARFSSDRRVARLLPADVTIEDLRRTDLLGFAARRPAACTSIPLLFMDGEREGERPIAMLREAAARMECATHVTVPGSHHYCGAYQLPWPWTTIHVRPEIFERCFSVLAGFLSAAVSGPEGS
jgi:pimeloyl-ACP methyl ester carboxylesterase